jgi:prevent-host-death family protein
MRTLTATAARRHFGALIKAVQHEPLLVVRRNGDKAIFISAEKYKQVRGITTFEPEQLKLTRKTQTSRGRLTASRT